jgi:dienelactone hydrolase
MQKGWARLMALLVALSGPCIESAHAGTEMRKVEFTSLTAPGAPVQRLTGELYLPDGAPNRGAVVLLSGCYGVEDLHRQWARDLAVAGYAALVVDSLTPRGVKEVCNDPWLVDVMARAEDAYGAKRFLAEMPETKGKGVALAGWSHGGWTLMHAVYPRKKRISDIIKSDGPFAAAIAIYPYCDVAEKFALPLLVLIGDADDWTPSSLCDAAIESSNKSGASPPVEYVVYPGATHSFDDPFGGDMEAIKAWIATEPPGTASLEPGGGFRYLGHLIRYDAAAHADARSRVLRFLTRHLDR